ncbi:MFS transporter [Paenibacillus sp. 1P07SE]|uniref:MFS transporter n=1 Tax=Paenibacillus sp. 1P07SE TaxID=3132209 RepID=UPI0039A687B3
MSAPNEIPQQPQLSATATRDAWRLRMFSFAFYTVMAVVVSYFPLYFYDRGYSEQQVGILYSIGPSVSIFANLIMGLASDKYRTIRKLLTLLLAGQLIMIALLLPVSHFVLVCFIMGGFYFFQTPVNSLNDSLILLSEPHTGRRYPSIRIFGSIGFSVAALLIGQFMQNSGSGLGSTMYIAMGSIVAALVLSLLLRDYHGSLRKMEFSGFFMLIRKPQIVVFFLLILVLSVAHRMNEGFLAIIMRQMGASESMIGTAWMISSASEIPVLYLLGKYGHRFKELPLLAFAGVAYALRFWLLSIATAPEWMVLIQGMHSITFGVFFSTALRYLSVLIPDEYRSSGQAVYAVVWTGFAGLLAGTVGGFVIEQHGPTLFFQAGMTFSLFAAAGFLVKHLRSR